MTTATMHASTHRSRALHVTLWIVQLLLAAFFLLAGVNHGLKPIAEPAQSSPRIADIPVWLARFIGFAEPAGAVGVVLPAATRVMPWLTPLAAAGRARDLETGGMVFAGGPNEIAERVLHLHERLGHSRQILQMDVGGMPHADVLRSIELLGTRVLPQVRAALDGR